MAAAQGEQLNELRDIFARFDMDSDGSLIILELRRSYLPSVSSPRGTRQLLEVFRSFDCDGNGYITAVELVGTMAKMG
ncbi:hypothetical protein MLD38_029931 [Melastoma candidum]|uniref:Uncharacterized protein n=1 Tax=Melastoma candidum TaxID=119954 RepID=A0ACB9MM13_9MYRT|nr:hypothetical protein MLD38_029931 [Melastoma candidum]